MREKEKGEREEEGEERNEAIEKEENGCIYIYIYVLYIYILYIYNITFLSILIALLETNSSHKAAVERKIGGGGEGG